MNDYNPPFSTLPAPSAANKIIYNNVVTPCYKNKSKQQMFPNQS